MKRINYINCAAILATALSLAACSDIFENRVGMQNTGSNATLSSLVVPDEELEKLPPPNQIFVSSPEKDRITINWSAVKNATSYRLERATSAEKDANGKWKIPAGEDFEVLEHSKSVYSTYFEDVIIDGSESNDLNLNNSAYGCAYFYRVAAENITRSVTAEEDKDYIMTSAATLLAPPPYVTASKGESTTEIIVSWEKPMTDGVNKYEVFRSPNSDSSGSIFMKQVTGTTSWVDSDVEQGKNYYYTIYALSAGGKSISSAIAYGYPLQDGAPSRANNVRVTSGRGNTNNQITIEWDSAANASGYFVFRSSSKDSTSLQIAKIDNASTLTHVDSKALKPNVYYYYEVQSYKTKTTADGTTEILGPMSKSGKDSNIVANESGPAEAYIISPPLEVNITKVPGDASKNIVTFTAALGSENCPSNSGIYSDLNTYKYKIYSCSTLNGNFEDKGEISIIPADTSGYYQAVVQAAKYYKMSTIFNGTVESKQSDVVAPAPYEALNCNASDNAAFGTSTSEAADKATANMNGVHAVRITWEAPIGGADGGYNVYRSTKPDSGFKKINESPIIALSYDDPNDSAKPGKLFYYRVLSLNSLGQGASYSNIDKGYGALTTYQYVREYIKTTLNSQKKLTLMHKSSATDKIGSESSYGDISGSLSYDASIAGLGGRVIMHYDNYADFYIMNDKSLGVYFLLNGNTNTKASMDTNGTMDGTVTIQGMYEGKVRYDNIKIKGGAAGGGTYGVWRKNIDPGSDSNPTYVEADWLYGEK